MGESARWHDGRFWCSDWVAGEILAIAVDGPDAGEPRGRHPLDVVPVLLRLDRRRHDAGDRREDSNGSAPDGALVPHADLVAALRLRVERGRGAPVGAAYVNGINFDMMGADGMNFELGSQRGLIAVVTPDGDRRIVADTVAFPNGMAITPDGTTLLVAESFASRVAAFDVDDDASLMNRRVWAEIDGGADGVSLDAEGALWCAARGRRGPAGAGRPDPPTDRARPSGLLRRPRRTRTGRRCSWSPTSGTDPRTSARARAPASSTAPRSRSRLHEASQRRALKRTPGPDLL